MDQDEILDRLRSTIHAWTEEVTQAHAELAGQISEARNQLETLAGVFGGNIPSAEQAQDHVRQAVALEEEVTRARAETAELQARFETLEDERESLRRELEHLSARADETERLSQELIEVRAENSALEEALREKADRQGERDHTSTSISDEEVQQLRSRIAALEEESATIRQVRENLRAERDKLRVQLLELHEAAGTVPDAGEVGEMQSRLADREAEVLRLEDALRAASGAMGESAGEVEALRARVEELESALAAAGGAEGDPGLEAETVALRERVSALESEIAAQADELQKAHERAASVEGGAQALESAEARIGELEARIATHESSRTNAEALQREIERLEVALNETASELERVRTESVTTADVSSALDEARLEIAKLKEREDELQSKLNGVTAQAAPADVVSQLEQERETLQRDLAVAKEAAAKAVALEKRAGELEQALNDRTRQLEDLEARMAEAQKRADFETEALRNERDTLRNQVGEKESEIAAQAEAISNAMAESELSREVPSLRDALERATAEAARLQDELRARDAALDETRETITQQDTALSEIQNELRALVSQRGEAPAELVGQLEDAIGQLEELHRVLAERDDEIATLKSEIESLGSRLQGPVASAEEMAALEERVAALQHELSEAQATAQGYEEIERALERMREENAALAEQIAQRDARMAELEPLNQALAESKAHVKEITDKWAGVDPDLPARHEQALERIAGLEAEAAARTDEISRLAVELNDARGALQRLDPALPDQLAAAQHRATELETALADSQRECHTAREQVAELETRIADNERELDEVRARLALADPSLPRKLEAAEGRIDELEGALDEARQVAERGEMDAASHQKLARELEELRDTHDKLKTESRAREERKELLEKEVARLKEQLSLIDPDLPGKFAKLKEQAAELRQTCETLEREKESVQRRLDEVGADLPDLYEDTVRQNESLRGALAQRDAEIASLRQQIEGFDEDADEQHRRIRSAGYDSQNRRRPMGEILVNAGVITQDQLEDALREQTSSRQRRLGSILVEKGYIREEMIGQVLATQLKLPFVRLAEAKLDPQALALVTGKQCIQHMLIPMKLDAGILTVAMANPFDLMAIEDVEFATHRAIQPVVATLADITSAIVRVYGIDKSREGAEHR